MKTIKFGKLKYFNVEGPDIDQHPIRKACRLFNRVFKSFRLEYFPKIKADILYLCEDQTPPAREMVKRARLQGIKTVVVQHGYAGSREGFTPLVADELMCWPEDLFQFESWGIPKNKLKPFTPTPPPCNLIKDVAAVMFLVPPAKGIQLESEGEKYYDCKEIIDFVIEVYEKEQNLLVKPHKKYFDILKPYLGRLNITWANADDLIYSAKRIYCFQHCTTVKDCEVLGKTPVIVDRALYDASLRQERWD